MARATTFAMLMTTALLGAMAWASTFSSAMAAAAGLGGLAGTSALGCLVATTTLGCLMTAALLAMTTAALGALAATAAFAALTSGAAFLTSGAGFAALAGTAFFASAALALTTAAVLTLAGTLHRYGIIFGDRGLRNGDEADDKRAKSNEEGRNIGLHEFSM